MSEIIHEFSEKVMDPDGKGHVARVMGNRLPDGKWEGFIVFTGPGGEKRATSRETLQVDREDLTYWASGLEHVYLEGAFVRASDNAPGL
jgi:hypothetical protein